MGAFNSLISNKDEVISDYCAIIQRLTDTTALETEADALKAECEVVVRLIQKTIEENARTQLDQTEYGRRYIYYINDLYKKRLRIFSNLIS